MAIADLEEAIQKAPAEASLLSDLSALYCERARKKDRSEDFIASLEMADRALSLKPDLPEAMFNRGIALEHLFLVFNAQEAWGRYLAIEPTMLGPLPIGLEDSNTPWTAEARSRRNDGALPIFPQFHQMRALSMLEKKPEMALRLLELRQPIPLHPEEVREITALNDAADEMERLGKSTEASRVRYRALTLSQDQDPSTEVIRSFKGAALDSLAQRRPMAALELQSQVVLLATLARESGQTVAALLDRAQIEIALGRQQEAKRDFSQALHFMNGVVSQDREALAARFDVVQREVDESGERAAALALVQKPGAQLEARADLAFQQGDAIGAKKHLDHALAELDRKRTKVPAGSDRISFFDQAKSLYMRLVALQLHLERPEVAFEVLERFRARTLLDLANGGTPPLPLSWREIIHKLPEQTTVLVYAIVEDRLITWIVQSTGISVSLYQPKWDAVSALVNHAMELSSSQQAADRRELYEQLYRLLVEPAAKDLQPADRIIFVPTRSLYSVPFAALRAPGSGRFLIQDHAIGVAPSVSEFLTALDRDRRLSAQPIASALLVGNPSFRLQDAPYLPAIPGAEREIETLNEVYEGLDVQTLTQNQATPSRVLDAIGSCDIAHLAVHGQQDREDPACANLLLAPGQGESGRLSANDILRTHLTRTRLVVLAACETQAGPVSESEGSLSLGHAFLAAGAPAVIGSLWLVDDESTERLSIRFHQELMKGADALSALRTAQLAEISAHPDGTDWTWASFQVYGGVQARKPSRSL